jgi:iron(III) transport system permease protein
MDPVLEEAAQVSGASMWQTMWRVSLPVLWPAILGGSIYILMTAVAMFEIAALLGDISGVPVLATELFLKIKPYGSESAIPRYGLAGVYALLITAPSLLLLFYYQRVIDKAYRFAVVTGKGYRPRDFDLGPWQYLGSLFVFVYVLLAVLLPVIVLVWTSLLPYLAQPSREAFSLLTFKWYTGIMDVIGGPKVLINTVLLIIATPILVLFFSFMISWVVVKGKTRGRRFIDSIAMLPHAIPGIGFAFALIVLAIMGRKWFPWIPLYQTVSVIILANVVNRISYASRITNAALLQVSEELEESALVCGARRLGTMWWVIVPLVKPSLIFGMIWTGLLVFREVSMALMLAGPHNQVLAARVWIKWQSGASGINEASALGVVMIFVMGIAIFVLQKAAGVKFSQAYHHGRIN